jgi:hypothetical protein
VFFNGRRKSETLKIEMSAYMKAKQEGMDAESRLFLSQCKGAVADECIVVNSVGKTKKKVCISISINHHCIYETCSQVSTIMTHEMIGYVDQLIPLRQEVGVPEDNPLLFATIHPREKRGYYANIDIAPVLKDVKGLFDLQDAVGLNTM